MRVATLVGYIDIGNGLEEMYALADTGEVFVCDYLMGNVILDPLTLWNPVSLTREAVTKMCKSTGADGIAVTQKELLVFKGNTASIRKLPDMHTEVSAIEFSSDLMLEDEVQLVDPSGYTHVDSK